jgi:hypothetical protein
MLSLPALRWTTVTPCDHDGVLDTGETGKVTISLRNTGLNYADRDDRDPDHYDAGCSFQRRRRDLCFV